MSYKELYNIHAYFSGPTKSMLKAANLTMPEPSTANSAPVPANRDEELRKIARAGRQWKMTIGRKVDMESKSFSFGPKFSLNSTWLAAYVYRLCIEWARLWSDDREKMSYKG